MRLFFVCIYFCLHLFLGLGRAISPTSINLCPISSTEQLPWLSYPFDVYDADSSARTPTERSYNCLAYESKELDSHVNIILHSERMINYTCPEPKSTNICPVSANHQANFLKTKHPKPINNSTFCSWANKLQCGSNSPSSANTKKKRVNVIVLGGSVAMGFGAFGCCCTDSKCHNTTNECRADYSYSRSIAAPHLTVRGDWELVPTSYGCAWSGRLVRWLNRRYSDALGVTFVLRNLAEGSANSQHTSHVLAKDLKSASLQLSSQDLIFLDHSFNDIGFQGKLSEGPSSGMEMLLRKIFMLSSSLPAVILLESYPYLYPERNRLMYDRLAEHYTLLHWSMRPVVESLAKPGSADSKSWDEYVRLHHLCFTDIHMSWHLHLFLSELMAHGFQTAMEECSRHCDGPTISQRGIPPPLHHMANDSHCSRSLPAILSTDAADVHHSPSSGRGTVSVISAESMKQPASSSTAAWMLKEDRPKKFGWIIDETGGNASLIFRPPAPTDIPDLAKVGVIIRIFFLSTYFNAGTVDVFYCGIHLGTIDALWEAWKTFRVSSTELFVEELGVGSERRDDRCSNTTSNLEIRYRPSLSFASTEEKTARNKQKVRIVAVKLCVRQQQE